MDYWDIYAMVNDWIKQADSKATTILAVQTVFVGFVLSKLFDSNVTMQNSILFQILLISGIFFNIASIFFSFLCLNPRLKQQGSKSPFYFGSISKEFPTSEDYARYVEELSIDESKINRKIIDQIHVNSRIAFRKFRYNANAIRCFVCSLCIWTLYIVIVIF